MKRLVSETNGKHLWLLTTTLSGGPLDSGDATARAAGAIVTDTSNYSPALDLSAGAAGPEAESAPTNARAALLESPPYDLPFTDPTTSTDSGVAMASESVTATPGIDENGEPIHVDSDFIVEVTAHQFFFEFSLPDAGITVKENVTIPDDKPVGFRGV